MSAGSAPKFESKKNRVFNEGGGVEDSGKNSRGGDTVGPIEQRKGGVSS